jgi:1-phosphatidylinositol-3-phosphate 5-kinase
MESPSAITFTSEPSDASSSFQASGRPSEDVASLTSFNPFSEEDEDDHSSYALMASLFSRVKNTFTTPLSSAPPPLTTGVSSAGPPNSASFERRRTSASVVQNHSSNESSRSSSERPPSMTAVPSHAAPPLVSLTPVVSEGLSFNSDLDLPLPRGALINTSVSDNIDGGLYGTTIPGFSIPEDSRSINTSVSVKRSASVSKVIRRIRGEGTPIDEHLLCENFTSYRFIKGLLDG